MGGWRRGWVLVRMKRGRRRIMVDIIVGEESGVNSECSSALSQACTPPVEEIEGVEKKSRTGSGCSWKGEKRKSARTRASSAAGVHRGVRA